MSVPPPRLVLIDGSGYIFRAFFALPPLNRPDGLPVGAVYGFSQMLHRLMVDMPDDDLVVIFDAGSETFRNELYADYKANRDEPPPELVPQFPLVREAARAFGLPVLEMEGYEADDLIATYARLGREVGQEVLIVSSDKDLMQLIQPGIAMYDPMKARAIDDDEVMARYGVTPDKVGDLLALAGDSSDNVPGVPGIGPKTAAQLLNAYGDLETLLARAGEIKQPKRRENLLANAEIARLSRKLVTLCEDAPVPVPVADLKRPTPDLAKLRAFLESNGFRNLVNRIMEAPAVAASAGAPVQPAPGGNGTAAPDTDAPPQPVQATDAKAITLDSLEALDRVLDAAKDAGHLSFDIETSSLSVARAELVGVALAVRPGEGYYLPVGHKDAFGQKRDGQVGLEDALERLRPVLADPSVLKIGHNLKYDLAVMRRYGVTVAPVDDTLLLSYVLDGTRHNHGMDNLAQLHLGCETIHYEDVAGKGKAQIPFAEVEIDKATAYAAEDAEVTLRLHQRFKPRLVTERQMTLYERIERPMVPVIAAIEATGVRVDVEVLRSLSVEFKSRMVELEAKAHEQAGHAFNLGSPKQLGDVLFGSMGLQSARKTATGAFATGANVLEDLAAQGHELARTVLDWRQLQKLTRTYTDALIEQAQPDTGRVHTSYSLAATTTGRLSSSDPNLQNIPIRTSEGRKIRRAFVPQDGYVLMSADYSQIELRILAAMAGIEPLKAAFADDVDVHKVTASQMFNIPVEQLDPDMRRNAKTINYGIIYGIGAYGLAQRLGIPRDVARDYIATYFTQYPGIRDYMDRTKAVAREQGYVETLFGRRCIVAEIASKNAAHRAGAERAAINAPIQGTAADIMKLAMTRVFDRLVNGNLDARLLLQVHDELLFEVPEDQVDATASIVRDVMEAVVTLDVPLVVDVGTGANWDEAH
ncbi:DNA polymerase I [Marinivivus vitaminiproducens]|uniref:DNA polymerase I n=1 Tax=Marinivivus vitaminiproducens TaxID=3035935 RepID=UPI0027A0AB6D|nr:DNA polymerase I [Geminicoccaceae bacterium SCSIO 64248]